MEETEPRDPITDVPIEQSDLPVYLPGTPTVSFTEYIERFVSMLFR
ncbi:MULTISPECIES: hypothetical protein [Natrialbaceae]|nr:hypothetical protein [Natronococcus sp. CG52]